MRELKLWLSEFRCQRTVLPGCCKRTSFTVQTKKKTNRLLLVHSNLVWSQQTALLINALLQRLIIRSCFFVSHTFYEEPLYLNQEESLSSRTIVAVHRIPRNSEENWTTQIDRLLNVSKTNCWHEAIRWIPRRTKETCVFFSGCKNCSLFLYFCLRGGGLFPEDFTPWSPRLRVLFVPTIRARNNHYLNAGKRPLQAIRIYYKQK